MTLRLFSPIKNFSCDSNCNWLLSIDRLIREYLNLGDIKDSIQEDGIISNVSFF